MPLAPPVTIAVRPASLAIILGLDQEAPHERFEARQLLFDQVDCGCILERERLLVELLRGKGNDHLGPAEENSVDRGQALPQVILRTRAAENAASSRLQGHRLVL